MTPTFGTELDDLITKWKAAGEDIGEMIADLQCAAEGLADEEEDGQ